MTEEPGKVQLNLITSQLEALITGAEVSEFRIKEAARAIGIKTNFQAIFD